MDNLIDRAAEAKCPGCGDTVNPGGNPYFSVGGNEMPDGSDCPDCQGTGLRYPILSRVCPKCQGNREYTSIGEYPGPPHPCEPCNGSGRVPDVTLEKITELVDTIKLDKYCDGWQCWITIEDNFAVITGYGVCEYGDNKNMPREAALAALLNSETPATPDRKSPTPG